MARAVDEAHQDAERARLLAEAAADESAIVLEGHVMAGHLPENEGGETWVSGPSLPAYQTPAHVGIRSRLGVSEDDAELLDYEKYVPAAR